jgi:hypothetical protein
MKRAPKDHRISPSGLRSCCSRKKNPSLLEGLLRPHLPCLYFTSSRDNPVVALV